MRNFQQTKTFANRFSFWLETQVTKYSKNYTLDLSQNVKCVCVLFLFLVCTAVICSTLAEKRMGFSVVLNGLKRGAKFDTYDVMHTFFKIIY